MYVHVHVGGPHHLCGNRTGECQWSIHQEGRGSTAKHAQGEEMNYFITYSLTCASYCNLRMLSEELHQMSE